MECVQRTFGDGNGFHRAQPQKTEPPSYLVRIPLERGVPVRDVAELIGDTGCSCLCCSALVYRIQLVALRLYQGHERLSVIFRKE